MALRGLLVREIWFMADSFLASGLHTAAAHIGLPARAAVVAPSCTTAISGQS
jgi:hypothetical protein